MVSSASSASSVPWHNRPARPFPAKVWVEGQYGFCFPPLRLRQGRFPLWRPFPAQVWAKQQAGD